MMIFQRFQGNMKTIEHKKKFQKLFAWNGKFWWHETFSKYFNFSIV